MAVKLTKNELKVQKDRLKQFQRYLPTLQLKKQQLQSVVMQITAQLEQVEREYRAAVDGLDDWVAVFAENDAFPRISVWRTWCVPAMWSAVRRTSPVLPCRCSGTCNSRTSAMR